MNTQFKFRVLKNILFYIFFSYLSQTYIHANVASTITSQEVVFDSVNNTDDIIDSLPDYNILSVTFKFDPYSVKIIKENFPDGYITINGRYDMNELIVNRYFYPLLENPDLKFLIIDFNSLVQNSHSSRIDDIKLLIEKFSKYAFQKKHNVHLALKFDYSGQSQKSVNTLFAYTSIPILIEGIQITKGYNDFFINKSKSQFIKKIKYLNLSSNRIGAETKEFNQFIKDLALLKKIQILDLQNNSIGANDKTLNQFADSINTLDSLEYINLENNLLGAHEEDTKAFETHLKDSTSLSINFEHNLIQEK